MILTKPQREMKVSEARMMTEGLYVQNIFRWNELSEPIASCAIESDPLANRCIETMRLIEAGKPITDEQAIELADLIRKMI